MAKVHVNSAGQRIYSSPYPDIPLQANPNLVDFLLHNDRPGAYPTLPAPLRMTASRLATPAFVDALTGRTQTYAELRRDVDRMALGLASPRSPWGGVEDGTVVAVFSPNHFYYATVLFGVLRAGATATTSNPFYTVEELVYQLEDSGASIVVAGESVVGKALAAMSRVGLPESNLIILPSAPRTGLPDFQQDEWEGGVRAVSVESVLKGGEGQRDEYVDADGQVHKLLPDLVFKNPEEARRRVAFYVYSSGTTGRAKGVMLTHYNICNNCLQLDGLDGEADYPEDGRRIAAVLPLYHIYGLVVVAHRPLLRGATIHVLPSYSLPSLCSTIQKYKLSFIHIVPPQLLQLAKKEEVDSYDLSSLSTIVCGAAPFSYVTVNELRARLNKPKLLVKNAWGMSELAPGGTGCPSDREIPEGSIGVPLPSVLCRVVDPDTMKDVEEGAEGELWCKGPNVMLGYLGRPEATAETIVEDNWLRTGDIVVSRDRFLFITDRLKELIKFNGLQVAPAELEALILSHPSILDAAVIPLPHPDSGEVPKAYAVLKPGFSQFDLAEWVAGKVSPHKRLRGGVEWTDEIPKSPSGKILRRVLVERERERAKVRAKL